MYNLQIIKSYYALLSTLVTSTPYCIYHRLPGGAPEGELAGDGGGGDPLVPVSPEPPVNIDWLQLCGVTALVEEITFPATRPHGGDVV